MWFIIDDQMADDRRIRRLPLATVGLWVKLCVIHSKGVSMQSKDPNAYPGRFDRLDLKDAGGTMRQLQQLIDAGLMEEHDGGWRPVYAEGICKEPKTLSPGQLEARRKAGSRGGRSKAANRKAKQTSSKLLANGQANGEQDGSETSSKLLANSQAKTWHKTDTYTDIPFPTPPAGKPKQTGTEPPDAGYERLAETYPGTVGAKGRKPDLEARSLYAKIAEDPAQLARLQSAVRRYQRAVNDGQVRSGHIPRLNTWLRDQWQTWAPEPTTPTRPHRHTWDCEHVHRLMDPHEDEYDHTGSLRDGHPSEWWQACQACAENLNQQTSKEKQ
ncbi:hypothetical protein [Bifidobacterium moukalabense]|uniref:Zinc finger protein 575 n=1 Tax=Bifidobacterium moukalabense DSM 27321 TaxID=1435051 RepID=W4NB45_9BIFI|nr:hypothetical protein [Bifidobacterium moukalabense]ETY72239.1 zinc finger protein 575 [Bifidobacterium moukalabense DSM 27321]